MFDNLKVEWVPGAVPTVYYYGADKQEIANEEVGDKDLKEVLELMKAKGFVPEKKKVDMGTAVVTKTFGSSVYEVYSPGRLFADAKEFAESQSLNGVKGHLLTVTSKEENDEVVELLKNTAIEAVWLGASDEASEGISTWVSGPESGTVFFEEGKPTNSFVNWKAGEPNNVGKEDCATFTKDGTWNDVQCEPSFYSVVVEYSTVSPSGEQRTDL